MIEQYLQSPVNSLRGFTLHRGRPQREEWRDYPRLKIIISLLGPANVGKSCLAQNVDHQHNQRLRATIATDISFFYSNVLFEDRYVVVIQLNDCPGSERFESVSTHHFRNCHGAILIGDTTDITNFDRLEHYWYKTLRDRSTFDHVELVLALNKIDLLEQNEYSPEYRENFFSKAQQFASRYQIPIFNISAERGDNISAMFHRLISNILSNHALVEHLKNNPVGPPVVPRRQRSTVTLSSPPRTPPNRRKKSSSCCG